MAAALAWLFVEWAVKGKPSLLGMLSGAVAGLVAVTPASGFAGPMGSIVLGLVAGAVCFVFVSSVKNAFGYDDSLDVFGIHCIGGILGALGDGHPGQPRPRRRRHPGLRHQAGRAHGRRLCVRPGDAGAGQGGAADAGLVGHRLGDPLQGRRPDRGPARHRRKRSAKGSISPITASAPTATERFAPPRRGAPASRGFLRFAAGKHEVQRGNGLYPCVAAVQRSGRTIRQP